MYKTSTYQVIIKYLLLIIFSSSVIMSCQKEEALPVHKGKIQFTFSPKDEHPGNILSSPNSILVTIKDESGVLIFENKKLSMNGGEAISEELSLNIGNFSVTEFALFDEFENKLYEAPHETSELAKLVDHPLPILFTIEKDKTKKVTGEVVMVQALRFAISIYAYNINTKAFDITDANVSVSTQQHGSLLNKKIPASVSTLTVKNGLGFYSIEVIKPGFLPFKKVFAEDEIKQYGKTNPLKIKLLKASIQQGIVAHYPFNGNAKDSSSNHFDGVIYGPQPTTDRDGNMNSAYEFDGIDDYIRVPHHDALNLTGNFSISLWVLAYQPQNDLNGEINDILTKWLGDSQGYPYTIRYFNSTSSTYKNSFIGARYDGSVCRNVPIAISPEMEDEEFHHVVFIKDGTNLKLYIDQLLVSQLEDTTECNTSNSSDLTIGRRGGVYRHFSGKIDDIRIYNRAISEEEIGNLYGE